MQRSELNSLVTTGNWVLMPPSIDVTGCRTQYIRSVESDGNGKMICAVFSHINHSDVPISFTPEEGTANGHLLSAAKEMQEAIQSVLATDVDLPTAVRQLLEQSLAKSNGEI